MRVFTPRVRSQPPTARTRAAALVVGLTLGFLLGGCARPAGQPGLALAAQVFVPGERVLVVAARFEDLQPGTYELSADLKDGLLTVTGGLQRWEQNEAAAVVIQGLSLKAELGAKKTYTVEVKLNGRVIATVTIPTE